MQDFKKLRVWKAAMDLSDQVYRITETFPDIERYGLVSQMRRSAGSVCDNIAEGCGRAGRKEMAQSLSTA